VGSRVYPNVPEKEKNLLPLLEIVIFVKIQNKRQMADEKQESKSPFRNSIHCKR
jgi:hypothetical protein